MISWATQDDRDALAALEVAAYPAFPPHMLSVVRDVGRDCITLVYRLRNRPLGYLVYRVSDEFTIEQAAVLEQHRRKGIAGALVRRVCAGLSPYPRKVVACVPESCLPAQLLFRSCGFRVTQTLHGYFEEDGYLFVHE